MDNQFGIFVLVASNFGDEEDARRTIRHELLGYYGLNTFKQAEKRALLDSVAYRDRYTVSNIITIR